MSLQNRKSMASAIVTSDGGAADCGSVRPSPAGSTVKFRRRARGERLRTGRRRRRRIGSGVLRRGRGGVKRLRTRLDAPARARRAAGRGGGRGFACARDGAYRPLGLVAAGETATRRCWAALPAWARGARGPAAPAERRVARRDGGHAPRGGTPGRRRGALGAPRSAPRAHGQRRGPAAGRAAARWRASRPHAR